MEDIQNNKLQKYTQNITKFNNKSDFLSCIICYAFANNAYMCPKCSKIACKQCFKQWLCYRKSECPNCRQKLTIHQIVNCSRLTLQVKQALEIGNISQLSDNTQLKCKMHQIEMQYFCRSCQQPICSDCAILQDSMHSGHVIQKLTVVHEKQKLKIQNSMKNIKECKEQLKNQLEEIKKVQKLRKAEKQEKCKEIEKFFNHMLKRFELEEQDKFKDINKIKEGIYNQIIQLKGIYNDFSESLNQLPKSLLVGKAQQMISLLREYNSQDYFQKGIKQLPHFQSQLIPSYQSTIFIINSYSTLKSKQPIYSQSVIFDKIQWRLKVYPIGNQSVDGNLSIFVELVKGINKPTKFKYKIEIVNQRKSQVRMNRQYQSVFQQRQCWGYNGFAKISTLYQQGYLLQQTDLLQIKLYIKACNYYSIHEDRLVYLKQLQITQKQNQKQLQELKEKLNNGVYQPEQEKLQQEKKQLIELDQIKGVKPQLCQQMEDNIIVKNILPKLERAEKQKKQQEELLFEQQIIKKKLEKLKSSKKLVQQVSQQKQE